MIKLWEKSVVIRCLQRDVELIESVLDSAKHKFRDLVKKEMDIDFTVDIVVEKDRFLQVRDINDNTKTHVEDYDQVRSEIIDKNDEIKKWFLFKI